MLKGFRDFILRGNVIELAVAVVIGTAFNNVVTQFTRSFVEPLIRRISGSSEVKSKGISIGANQFLDWAGFVNVLVMFLITAAVVYFVFVFPMNKLAERRARGEEPAPKTVSEDIRLLTEIRDLLAAGNPDGAAEIARGNAADRPPVRPGE